MTGYCLKCRESREMQEAEQITMKNGRPATRGKCDPGVRGVRGRDVQDRYSFLRICKAPTGTRL